MKIKPTGLIPPPRWRKLSQCQSIGRSDTRIVISLHEAMLIRSKYSRPNHRQRETAKRFRAPKNGLRSFVKAYAVLWRNFNTIFSEYTFDQGNRVVVSRVATDFDIRDRVSMQTGRPSRVPNHPIERRPSDLVQLPRAHKSVPASDVTKSHPSTPRRQIKGGSSELQII
jgi:hypothetical protein